MKSRKKPRLLQAAKYYAPRVGGIERVLQDISDSVGNAFDVRVLACNPGGALSRDVVSDVPVVRAATPAVVFSMPLSLQYGSLFRRMAREADLIQFHHPFPLAEINGLLDGCRGKGVVVWYHCDIVRQKWAMPAYGGVLRRFLSRADRILVSSDGLRRNSVPLSEFRDKTEVVPFGLDLHRLRTETESFPLPAEEFLLFVGRLVPYKGCEVLIRAMKRAALPLLVAGTGPLKRQLQRLARQEGVASRVHFLGRIPDGKLRYCYSRCRMLVLPSVNPTEAFGLVQVEAMAHGKPVVNTALPTGVPEVSLDGETGLTVPPGNPDALADAITRLHRDDRMYRAFASNARRRSERFSIRRFRERLLGVYGELLNRRASATHG